jgi:hypothetical protein
LNINVTQSSSYNHKVVGSEKQQMKHRQSDPKLHVLLPALWAHSKRERVKVKEERYSKQTQCKFLPWSENPAPHQ